MAATLVHARPITPASATQFRCFIGESLLEKFELLVWTSLPARPWGAGTVRALSIRVQRNSDIAMMVENELPAVIKFMPNLSWKSSEILLRPRFRARVQCR